MAPTTKSPPSRSWSQTLTLTAIIVAALSALYYFLDSHLEWFYIFTPEHLHDLSIRAIGAHGNDTRAVVAYIVDELSGKLPGGYINLDEEWIFNNAGGAMGAMYIIHASKLSLNLHIFIANHIRHHGISHNLRFGFLHLLKLLTHNFRYCDWH